MWEDRDALEHLEDRRQLPDGAKLGMSMTSKKHRHLGREASRRARVEIKAHRGFLTDGDMRGD